MDRVTRDLPIVETKASDDGLTWFVASTSNEDLMGDTIAADGWDLSRVTNPRDVCPFLLFHNSRSLPIGRVEKVKTGANLIEAGVVWDDEDPDGKRAHGSFDRGFIKTVSVGFWPTKYSIRRDDKERFLGFHYEKQKLLELSLVPIPANPDAVTRSVEEIDRMRRDFPGLITPAPTSKRKLAAARVALMRMSAPGGARALPLRAQR